MSPSPNKYPVPLAEDHPLHDLIWRQNALPMTALAQEVGLFERLQDQPATIEAVAAMLDVTPRAAEIMVAVVAALGFLEALSDGRFGLTAVGRTYLLPSSPFAYGPFLSADHPTLDKLRRAFLAGEPSQPLAVNMETLSIERVRKFITQMHATTFAAASGLAGQDSLARVQKLLDVGGGSGSLSLAIAAHYPQIQCTIMDFEPVCVIAREYVAKYGFEDRVGAAAVDMFREPWPAGYDGVLFGNIFHDWDVDTCHFLAQRAFEILEPGGTILLHEMPLNDTKDGPLTVACFSISMLLHEKGKQYTSHEFKAMLTHAGFTDFRSVPTFGYYHLVSAIKP